jgi:hypothetical protein
MKVIRFTAGSGLPLGGLRFGEIAYRAGLRMLSVGNPNGQPPTNFSSISYREDLGILIIGNSALDIGAMLIAGWDDRLLEQGDEITNNGEIITHAY